MIAILVISHEPLGTALINCLKHVYRDIPRQVAALDVIPDEPPEHAMVAARDLIARISDGSGVLVLTDLCGATPSRIARELFAPYKIAVLCGVNLPIIIKAISLRRSPMPITDLVDQLREAGRDSVIELLPEIS